jgi:hypothetical protein
LENEKLISFSLPSFFPFSAQLVGIPFSARPDSSSPLLFLRPVSFSQARTLFPFGPVLWPASPVFLSLCFSHRESTGPVRPGLLSRAAPWPSSAPAQSSRRTQPNACSLSRPPTSGPHPSAPSSTLSRRRLRLFPSQPSARIPHGILIPSRPACFPRKAVAPPLYKAPRSP